ncbi:PstS family phosphate ABC transporter substrate-binding protein [Acinetobacter stercoris]|uniref:Phosphate-binding protein PstS n=1 Tax=Acinetobacter stercoris TaxID=2126983 RepID=A0A2U3N2Y2_9GAMM|nr:MULTISPECIES: substrate-binding domain-containing protein [Acinetobacter]SPL72046.1 Alkaline phosphatase L precursor [Acinetobacter stercoris]
MKMNKIWSSISAVMFAAGFSVSAQAVDLAGQGASLPELAYTGLTTLTPAAPVAGSLFGQYNTSTGNAVTYIGNGSGSGKNAIINGTSPFAGSDSPLTQTNYTAFLSSSGAARVAPVQVPAIVGAVAVVYNSPAADNLDISSETLAKIFAGDITDWKDVPNSGVTTSLPIKLVARSSGSGTTFSFVNHLNAIQRLPSQPIGTKVIKVDELFSNAVAGLGVTFVGQSNNQAVVDYVKNNAGTIGYAEAGNAYKTGGVKVAKINGYSPEAPTTTFLNNLAIANDQVITGNNANGTVILSPITNVPAGKTGFVKIVRPALYANPANTYPILAVSYLLGNTNGNGDAAKVAAVKGLLKAPYNVNYQTGLNANLKKGFAFIPSTVATSLSTTIDGIQ